MKTNNIPVIVSKTETITKPFRGKAIYSPSGKAGEYSYWACNFYKGCSNGCTYCFLKKGRYKATLGGDKPTLKKSFKNEDHALVIFKKELSKNWKELNKYGLFFTFTSDPLLEDTVYLTAKAVGICIFNGITVKILSKDTHHFVCFFGYLREDGFTEKDVKEHVCFGFTLTGHDELEPDASPNAERIEMMKMLHKARFKTFASIEPVIDFQSSKRVILESLEFCDQYKIGLESGKKYKSLELRIFISWVLDMTVPRGIKVYFKDTLLKQAGISRSELPDNCVGRDYNILSNIII